MHASAGVGSQGHVNDRLRGALVPEFSPFIALNHCLKTELRKQQESHFQNHLSIISTSCPMAFMCRSARAQRWSAGTAKKPLFQTPTVPENCKGASLHTSAYFLQLHYHKSVFQDPGVETLFHWCLYKSVLRSMMQ